MPSEIRAAPLITTALSRAAQATGVEFTHLLDVARRESSLNPAARAPTSSAAGLFQFIERTWLEMVRRHGAEHGLAREAALVETRNGRPFVADPSARQAILDLRYDAELSARMAAELTRENAEILSRRLGRPPTPSELYAAHVLGPSGAGRLIAAAADGAANAATLFPREAAANPWLFYRPDGSARSAADLLERLSVQSAGVASETRPKASPPTPPAFEAPAMQPELGFALLVLQAGSLRALAGDLSDAEKEAPEISLLRAGLAQVSGLR